MSTISTPHPAAQLDRLLAEAAAVFGTLPRTPDLPCAFREALAYNRLPGGYVHRGAVARPLTQTLGEPQC
jgi:hypothetical protein